MAGLARHDVPQPGNAVTAVDTNLLVYAHRRESPRTRSRTRHDAPTYGRWRPMGDSLAMLPRVPQRRDQPPHLERRGYYGGALGFNSMRGPRHRRVDAICAIAGGRNPPDRPRSKDLKIHDLIKRPRNSKPVGVVPGGGEAPAARAGPLALGTAAPGAAAHHTAAAVTLPAVFRPLPHVAHHVRKARRIGTVTAHDARAPIPRPPGVATGAQTPPPPFPIPPPSAGDTSHPSSGSATTHTPARRSSSRMLPDADPSAESRGPARNRQSSRPHWPPSPTRTPDTLLPSPRTAPAPDRYPASPPSPDSRRSLGTPGPEAKPPPADVLPPRARLADVLPRGQLADVLPPRAQLAVTSLERHSRVPMLRDSTRRPRPASVKYCVTYSIASS